MVHFFERFEDRSADSLSHVARQEQPGEYLTANAAKPGKLERFSLVTEMMIASSRNCRTKYKGGLAPAFVVSLLLHRLQLEARGAPALLAANRHSYAGRRGRSRAIGGRSGTRRGCGCGGSVARRRDGDARGGGHGDRITAPAQRGVEQGQCQRQHLESSFHRNGPFFERFEDRSADSLRMWRGKEQPGEYLTATRQNLENWSGFLTAPIGLRMWRGKNNPANTS
jgi:hypothetical protein